MRVDINLCPYENLEGYELVERNDRDNVKEKMFFKSLPELSTYIQTRIEDEVGRVEEREEFVMKEPGQ